MNCLSFKTKFGWISAFEKKNRIVRLKFAKHKSKSVSENLKKVKSQISNFLNNKNKKISIKLQVDGNSIQKKVWRDLAKIKFGETKSYGQIAKKYKLSPRHVGKICGQNKIVLAIPCHRVIRSDGSIGGFSSAGGIKLKKQLLDFEKKSFISKFK
tara:strand:+ start:45 stop:509 length:465 start_codon:yes stop_codon:yes gene_type:complete